MLEAMGVIGNYLMLNHPIDWMTYIRKVSNIDWSRGNSEWLGRSFGHMGRINKNGDAIRLTANLIKTKIGLPLNQQEQALEAKLKAGDVE